MSPVAGVGINYAVQDTGGGATLLEVSLRGAGQPPRPRQGPTPPRPADPPDPDCPSPRPTPTPSRAGGIPVPSPAGLHVGDEPHPSSASPASAPARLRTPPLTPGPTLLCRVSFTTGSPHGLTQIDVPLLLGVVWYLVANEAHNLDRKHVAYLEPTHRASREPAPSPHMVRTYRELLELTGVPSGLRHRVRGSGQGARPVRPLHPLVEVGQTRVSR